MDKKVWMTPEGYQKLQAQLEELCTVKRPAVLQNLQEVSGSADWRENSQLIHVQDELALIDAEIRRLQELLAQSEVVEPQTSNIVVDIGETVVLQTDGEIETYTIVSPAESDPDAGRISYESPVGHTLLKHKVGDEVEVKVPAGLLHYRIVAVR
ncbi:MAG: transcription elongation factor GreA [Chloroflexi bacterium]|nr:MAG: transcription elongation factor GreA [Chloroflexota bacterium]